jgi:zinc D-Ala-D-Ala dipeptidase
MPCRLVAGAVPPGELRARTRRGKDASVIKARMLVLAIVLATAVAGCSSGRPAADHAAAPSSTPEASAVPSPAPTASSTPSLASSQRPTPTKSPNSTVPPVSAKARAAGLIDVRTVVPDAIIDMRYSTADNFTKVRLYPFGARCLVHQSMARGLTVAANRLRHEGYRIVFWDCYRPHSVQVRMFRIVPNPNWVAKPGPYAYSHEAARSVDITLAYASAGHACAAVQRVQHLCLLEMGTGFDSFTPRAYAFATAGVSRVAHAHRAMLRTAMRGGGITVYVGEWWHFDGPGADVRRPILDVPLT